MNIRTANTIVYCKQWEETVVFYQTKLKLPVTFSNDWFVEFKLNETARLSVANEARASINSSGGQGVTISLKVNDVAATCAYLKEAGLNPTPIKELWGSKVSYVLDPEGHRLEFWS